MSRVLVTGGTGMLGRVLVPKLHQAGYSVRVMSRHPRSENVQREIEWAQADVLTGEGLRESVREVDVIIHGASNPIGKNMYAVEVEGTRNVLNAARDANISHFIYVSIVGIDRTPHEYYTAKLAAERVVETFSSRSAGQRNFSTTILRGTQFFELIDFRLQHLARFPIVVLDPHMKFQPVDVREFSDALVELARKPAQGLLPDFGGPQILGLGEILREWLRAKQLRRFVVNVRAPGKFADACRRGLNTNALQRCGKITWRDWLAEQHKTFEVSGNL